jgi:hypothetical protein
MALFIGPGQDWEQIVELARRIDHGVAARQGIDSVEVLRLAHALVAFQRRLASGSILTPVIEPAAADSPRED